MLSALWKRKAGNEDREGEIGVLRVHGEGLSGEVIFQQRCKVVRHTVLREERLVRLESAKQGLWMCSLCVCERSIRKGRVVVSPGGWCWEMSSEKLLRACSCVAFQAMKILYGICSL